MNYLDTVRSIQESGSLVAYPGSMPDGWNLEEVTLKELDGVPYSFNLAFTTQDGGYVGVMETPENLADFMENARPGVPNGSISIAGQLGGHWECFGSDFDDPAYAREFSPGPGLRSIAVHGSDLCTDLVQLIQLLTTARA